MKYASQLAKGPTTSADMNGWRARHMLAIESIRLPMRGSTTSPSLEIPMVAMVKGWAAYADAHAARFHSKIGDDSVLGPAWAEMGRGLLRLLNGELGHLDAGTLDAFLRDTLVEEGFDPE